MAGKSILIVNCALFILLQLTKVQTSKLNVPRVLLPIFNDFSTNFTLEVTEGGCYKWTTSRLDLVQIVPLDLNNANDCCSRVMVSAISKEQTRNTAIVLAEEFYTGQVLRCDVIVDVIASLQVITTTRELFMEEAPEAFEVRAYDEQGNEFTTLDGIQFEWSLSCSGTARPGIKDINILRFITFRDSPYETPPNIQYFEELGTQGHIILLEGVKTGSAKVSVRLPHKEYKEVKTVEVQLMVVANLLIEPADVYILRGDVIHYRIIQVKHGRLEEINLPGSQYYLAVEDTNVGVIDSKAGFLTGLNIGKTRVQLHDRNVEDNDGSLKLPTATVSVILPAYITLTILPHRNWAILFGDQHDIVVEAYASNDHKIHLGEGVEFKTEVDETRFYVHERSKNGSWLTGRAKEQGIALVHTTLLSVRSQKLGKVILEPKLTAKAEIVIFPRILLQPHEVILPWDPIVRPKYDIEIRASGGDGKFLWSTTNRTVGSVTQSGLVRTQWHGAFEVCAAMSRNHHNRNCARFLILPPTKLEIVEFIMEAEIGSPLFLHVALHAQVPSSSAVVPVPFLKCNEIPFKVKISEQNFVHNASAATEPVGISCTTVSVVGLSVGTSRISVSYNRDDIYLEDSVVVSAYRPLELLHPVSGQSVLAVGTSRYLVFTGGPRPWPSRPSEHSVTVTTSDPVSVSAADMTEAFKVPGEPDTYIVSVTCRELGESTVTLKIANKPLFPNCKHKESVAHATIICGKPRSVHLRPDLKLSDANTCPMDLSAEKVIVQSYRNVELDVIVRDDNGRVFDNITSLQIKWRTNPKSYAAIVNRDNAFPRNHTHGNVILPHKNYQIVVPQSKSGTVDVLASVTGYRHDVLTANQIRAESPPFFARNENPLEPAEITSMITFYLVDDTVVKPNRTSVYNHPLNKVYLAVTQGSGFYELSLSSDRYANVKYVDSSREIEIVPVHNGELHIALNDLCLTSAPAQITVNVVSVNSIVVEMTDRVEISKCIPVTVKFYDELDELMPLPNLSYLNVEYTMEEDIVGLKRLTPSSNNPWPIGEVHYTLTGVTLGDTKLIFSTGRDQSIRSAPVPIQVFPPLRLQPRNITMLVGSYLELVMHGGPQPHGNIEFETSLDDVVEINTLGLVHGLRIGRTRIQARAVSTHPSTRQKIILSQDYVDVHVVSLTGVRIAAPLTRFLHGTTIPVWATSVPEGLTPVILGTVEPALKFMWFAQCNDIVEIHGIFHGTGIRYDSTNQVSVRINGLKPGRCVIDLIVISPGFVANSRLKEITFKASLEIEIYEELLLTKPVGFSGKPILMAPFTKLQLNTNRDGLNYIKYSLQNDNDADVNNKSLSVPNSIVTISQNGLMQSYGSPGRVMVLLTSVDEHGLKQTLHLVVQVKPIHYMMVNVVSNWFISSDDVITTLPVGSEMQLVATYHDNTGTAFTAAQSDVRYRLSRSDVLEVKRTSDNTSFHASVGKSGSVVLKLWTEGTHKTMDYIKFHATQLSQPFMFHLTMGDILCLSSPVVDSDNKKGSWKPDSGILLVNSSTGIVQVINAKNEAASIIYSLTPASKLHFNVEPISNIQPMSDQSGVLTNSEGSSSYKVPFVLSGDNSRMAKTTNLYMGWPCQSILPDNIKYFPFSCEIYFTNESVTSSVHEVFDVHPAFNEHFGVYYCNFAPSTDITSNTSLIESNITLRINADNSVQSEPIELNFIPGVFVQSRELQIDENRLSAMLIVTGLPYVLQQVKVEPVDGSLLQVREPEFITPTTVSFEVVIIDYHWKLNEFQDLLSVRVKSDLTNQFVKVSVKAHITKDKRAQPVCISGSMGSPAGNFFRHYQQTFYTILAIIILVTALIYAYSMYIQPVINVNISPDTPRVPYNQRFATADQSYSLSPGLNSSFNQSYGYGPSTCYNRTLNSSGPHRLSDGDRSYNDNSYGSPDIRRNKKFM